MVSWETRNRSRWTPALAGLLLVASCGGSAPIPPPAAPALEQDAAGPDAAAEQEPDVVKMPAAEASEPAPTPFVYGVDLDTVQAGAFDQGKMWTFEFPPVDYIAQTHGFRPDEAWFEKARLGALRIPNCSASFVSPNGLVLTNHHCARDFITQVSADGESLLDDGFRATDLADERAVEDFEADQLVEIIDVTDEVNTALDAVGVEQRGEARESLLEEIEARILEERGGEEAGFAVEMISLYNGGRTSAYVFRRYTHVKLVMAPELQIGFFGGDPDNFTFPRYNLDFSFFRVYDDDGEPLSSEHYFPFASDGPAEGDPVFIVGNPGSTHRLQTVAELEFRRDVEDRYLLATFRRRMLVLDAFIQANPEAAEQRNLRNEYFSLGNSEEAYDGQIRGLEDPIIIARRKDTERDFQAAIVAGSDLELRYGDLIERMAAVQERKRAAADVIGAFSVFGNPYLDSSTLIRGFFALQVIAMRQGGASPGEIEEMMENVIGTPQMHPDLDAALMADRFEQMRDFLGRDHPAVSALLGGATPLETARRILEGTLLSDSATAVTALQNGSATPQDAAVQSVIAFLPGFLELNSLYVEIGPIEEELAAELGRARFEIYGTDVPPDATFSLRIADGVVSGYEYNGTVAPVFTTFFGLYDRHYSHEGDQDWDLPERWLDPPATLDLKTPMNFVSTADIIGGNSGSPVLDRDLEVVGVVFDGNAESLPGDYIYLPEKNRSVTVHVRAILEALDEIYDLDRLVLELTTGELTATEAEADSRR
ncbi:MAG: S46 family peptidase [Gemmatimonadota bacterium]|nr:S46 family peptidase [Gemmatimonadota bacterium]